MHLESENLDILTEVDPELNFDNWFDARATLYQHVTVRWGRGGQRPLHEVLPLIHKQNNAFVCEVPLNEDYILEYHGPRDED